MNNMIKLISNIDIIDYNIKESPYKYNEKNLPRVTEIISSMIHEDYLMNWANYIGRYKHQNHNDIRDFSATVGTYTHNAIENYISNGIPLDINTVKPEYRNNVYNTYNSFLEWWGIILKNDVEILMQEKSLICPYFGGTLDLLLKINGRVFLFDFKTSNHPSYKYYLQMAAYIWMLNNYYDIITDGCGILMLNKNQLQFNEMVLDFNIPEHLEFINQCKENFLSLVYSYYMRINTENIYKNIFGGK